MYGRLVLALARWELSDDLIKTLDIPIAFPKSFEYHVYPSLPLYTVSLSRCSSIPGLLEFSKTS